MKIYYFAYNLHINIYKVNIEMSKCNGLDRYSNKCNKNKLDNINYCKFHEYLNNYNFEQLKNLKLCSGCCKWKYLKNENKTCDDCKIRSEKNNIKYKNNIILCKKQNCKFKKSNNNEYCGKHQIDYFKEETEKLKKKVCYNYTRGCREQLNLTYLFSNCQECLKNDREKDKEKKNKSKINNVEINNVEINNIEINNIEINNKNDDNNIKNNNLDIKNNNLDIKNNNLDILKMSEEIDTNIILLDIKLDKIIENINCYKDLKNNFIKLDVNTTLIKCTNDRCKFIFPKTYFISDVNNSITKQCKFCRDIGKEKDHKESRIISKKEWNENNHDKMSKYWMDFRGRKMEELGDKYWENNSKQMKNWRDNNPEKVKEINKKKRINIEYSFMTYMNIAKSKNTIFNISIKQFLEIVKNPCFYCGIIQEKEFNGIDKKICTDGYILDNIVSCCSMCNTMKGTLTPEVFYKRIEHILTYQEKINGNLYYEYFKDHNNVYYKDYKKRSLRLKIYFQMTEADFNEITNNNCYLCGKKNSNTHKNGIDRIDNNIGYVKTNIKSCCGNCNYMKNKFDLNELLNKILLIYENLKNYKFNDYIHIIEHKMNHLNKVTSEDKNILLNNKKKIQKEITKEKYNNEEYKKNRSLKLAFNRKNKNYL